MSTPGPAFRRSDHRLLALASVLAVLVLVLYWYQGQQADTASVTETTMSEHGTIIDANDSADISDAPPMITTVSLSKASLDGMEDRRWRRRAWAARSAQAAYAAAMSLPVGDPDRLQVLGMLRGFCREVAISDPQAAVERAVSEGFVADTPLARALHLRWREDRTRYCAGLDGDSLESQLVAERAQSLGSEDLLQVETAMLTALVNDPGFDTAVQDPSVQDWLWTIVDTSQSLANAESALQYLASAGAGPFVLAEAGIAANDITLLASTPAQRTEAIRTAAARLHACRTLTGCGPGGLSMLGEPYRSRLHPQTGLEGMLRDSFSPQDWEVVEAILADLMAKRRARGG